MGILNVTPDSFSDGGSYVDVPKAVDRGLEMVEEGVDLVDIGGESTRPNAADVDVAEELRRVVPVVEALAAQSSVPLSIDTRKVRVAREAVQAGAVIINDVEANRQDPSMWEWVAESGAGYVAMHMQGSPGTMQKNPQYDDVVEEVIEFFGNQLDLMFLSGVKKEQVMLDVGIGFGKTLDHNMKLLRSLEIDCNHLVIPCFWGFPESRCFKLCWELSPLENVCLRAWLVPVGPCNKELE